MAALILLSKYICLLPGFPDSTNVSFVETNVFKEHRTSNSSNNSETVSKVEGKVESIFYIIAWEWVVQRDVTDPGEELENLGLEAEKRKV